MDRFQRFGRLRRIDRKNALLAFFIIMFASLLIFFLLRLNATWDLKQHRVLVTYSKLTRGMRISATDLGWETYPRDKISPLYFTQNDTVASNVAGGVAVRDIPANQAISRRDIILPNSPLNYQQLLQPNMRAVMLPILELGPGFVRSGDYVDILLTFALSQFATVASSGDSARAGGSTPATLVTRTLLKNVLVLGVYSPNQAGAVVSGGRSVSPSNLLSRDPGTNKAVFWVTFELNPKQAELMTVAKEMGIISLSLQGQVVGEIMHGNTHTTSEYVAGFEPRNTVTIIRGLDKEVVNLER